MKRIALVLALAACGSVVQTDSAEDDPVITSIAPDHGPSGGGVTVTVTGAGLGGASPLVLVGGTLATDVQATGDSELTFKLPPGVESATVSVVVGNEHGFSSVPAEFRYNPSPQLVAITPAVGRTLGGTQVTVTGRGFQLLEPGVPTLRIGGGLASNVQIIDDTTLTATTGPASAEVKPFETADVELENQNGTSVLPSAFTLTARGLLVFDRGANVVHFVDKASGRPTRLNVQTRSIRGCATRDGIMYGIAPRNGGGVELFTFDPLSGAAQTIGPVMDANVFRGVSAIAFLGTRLLGIDASRLGAGTLKFVDINTATGVSALIPGAITGGRPYGIAAKDTSSLFYTGAAGLTLDTASVGGTASVVAGPAVQPATQLRVHGLVNLGGTIYLLDKALGDGRIFTINPATGAISLLANLPFPGAAMCETPSSY